MILDTDMGNDIDDALALAMVHALEARGECELLGVVSSKANPYSAAYIDVVNTFYGRGDVPLGVVRGGVTPDDRTFIRPIVTARDGDVPRYPRTRADEYEDAVPLLRRLLAERDEQSVTVVMIGFSTNMAQLLASPADEHSELDGAALLSRKARCVLAMAGDFSDAVQRNPTRENREYNVHCDVASAAAFFNHCPVPVVFCGYEVGNALLYPAASIERDYGWAGHHPVAEAYRLYMQMPYDRPLWDPATVLEAVRPGTFASSPPGRAVVDAEGIVRFEPLPRGPHRYLKLGEGEADKILRDIVSLCAQPVQWTHVSPLKV